MQQALTAPSDSAAASLWHQADMEAMSQAAVMPLEDPNYASIHGSQVHNCVFIGPWQGCDMANVWLS
jgi:hypothetical protein